MRSLGAAVDGLHAGSTSALAALDVNERRPAVIDASVATAFCALGLAVS